MDGMSALAIGLMIGCGAWLFLDPANDYLRAFGRFHRLFDQGLRADQGFWPVSLKEQLPPWSESLLFDTHSKRQGPNQLEAVKGAVRFENVHFAYSETAPKVLHGIDFEVNPSEVVAIVGATGSGKTTIAKLLTRLYGDYHGRILIDGLEVGQLTREKEGSTSSCLRTPFFWKARVREHFPLGA